MVKIWRLFFRFLEIGFRRVFFYICGFVGNYSNFKNYDYSWVVIEDILILGIVVFGFGWSCRFCLFILGIGCSVGRSGVYSLFGGGCEV